eukprot:3327974-Rhodomonas_salina.1
MAIAAWAHLLYWRSDMLAHTAFLLVYMMQMAAAGTFLLACCIILMGRPANVALWQSEFASALFSLSTLL